MNILAISYGKYLATLATKLLRYGWKLHFQ